MALVLAYRERNLTRDITIQDAAGETIVPGANDQVRVMIGRQGDDPQLTVASNAPTANGSTLTKATATTANRLRLDAQDLVFSQGTYTMFIDYFDVADASEWKHVDRQIFVLEESEAL
jgi:hypothetical protein